MVTVVERGSISAKVLGANYPGAARARAHQPAGLPLRDDLTFDQHRDQLEHRVEVLERRRE